MIVVYTGKSPQVNVEGVSYDRNTPSYIDPARFEIAKNIPGIALYKPSEEYGGEKRTIYVKKPQELDWFLPARRVLQRIKKNFPLSPIKCRCRSEFVFLLPDGVSNEPMSS